MRSAQIVEPKKPLQVNQFETPKPAGQQVLVRVHSCGVCHSDIHLWEGGYEGKGGQIMKTTDRGVKYPLTPGHEISGIIDTLGEDVMGFDKDDKVIVYPWIGDGICPACRAGEENLCDHPRSLGVLANGGYSDYVLVPNYRYLIKIDKTDNSNGNNDIRNKTNNSNLNIGNNDISIKNNIGMDAAATLTCSSLTAYRAVKNAVLKPYDNVVVVGAGGLGLMSMQLIKALTGATTIAIDIEDSKLKDAKKDGGADITINSSQEDPVNSVMSITNGLGADAVIDFVNASKTVETDMQIIRKRARVVLVGLFGGELRLNLVNMPTRAYQLVGSYTGTINDLLELVSLAKRGVINPVISNHYKLDQATDALTMLKEGRVHGRGVINP